MTTRLSGRMVVLVREAQGWTQADLARTVKVSQGSISKIERGLLSPDQDVVVRLASALGVPPALLIKSDELPGLEVTCMHHRRRASRLTVATAKRVEGVAQLASLSARRLADGVDLPASLPLRRVPLQAGMTAGDVAAKLRADWGVTSGPLDNVTSLLEDAGIMIVVRAMLSEAQDAVSTWPREGTPIIVLNAGLPVDRARFTLAHELGHLLMHSAPAEGQEEEANAFAAEFLMPAEMIRKDLEGLTVRQFKRLATLKGYWKVSMAALIQRALQLGCISPSQFKSFRVRLNQYGWARREPVDLPPEPPTVLRKAITRHLAAGLSVDDLAHRALMLPEHFRDYLQNLEAPAATTVGEDL